MKPPLERNPTKKRHSWWWDSHISPKNSKWLAENIQEMDKQVKEMLQLIEEDGDSFAKKAQMYYQRRPMLIIHVENFYRMYRALAERYDNVTGELRKNIPTRLQSTGSLTGSECGSELQRSPSPSPEPLQRSWTREQSPRAAGFDFFLSNKNNDSPASRKEPEDLASQSESDAKSEDGEDDGIAYTLHQRVLELEDELNVANQKLRDANGKLEVLEEENLRCHCDYKENGNGADQTTKVSDMEGELTATREKLQSSLEEIVNMKEEVNSTRKKFEDELSERDAEISRYKEELADASEKLLQEKSANGAQIAELQEMIEDIRFKLEKVSEEKLLVENHVKELEEANAEADKYSQELTQATETLSEEKFRHEAVILTMQQSIEDLKFGIESLTREKLLMTSWFADLEQVVGRGRSIFTE
ncbi:protein NETWORKED 4B-like [Phragmites australis]|uniref:protein NETWORKED 4B-like n=1 Tax=Phragmites australis TaxID=29695 RepID=UPI002D78982E|nr:protein NETWORKED 4B-like [Phragmites australis]XP_062193638.1 protein NETWORKED 4B-like [Phragmites australis]